MRKGVIIGISVFVGLYLLNLGLSNFFYSRIMGQSKEAASVAQSFSKASLVRTQIMEFYSMEGRLPDNNQELGIGRPEAHAGQWVKSLNVGPKGLIDLDLKDVGEEAHIYLQPVENLSGVGSAMDWRCYARGLEQSVLDTIHSPVCTLLGESEALPADQVRQEEAGPATVDDLVNAVYARRRGLIKSLISRGVNVNGRNRLGESPLRAAIERGTDTTVRDLIAAGANVNEVLPDPDARTLLMHAAERRSYGAGKIRALLDAGAKLEARSTSGKTPLMVAAIANDHMAVTLFLERGANMDTVDNKGKSALDYAVMMHGGGASVYRQMKAKKEKAKEFIYRLPES